jgi:hypothetical protein
MLILAIRFFAAAFQLDRRLIRVMGAVLADADKAH